MSWYGAWRIDYLGRRGRTTRGVRLQTVIMERGETLLNCLDLDKGEARQFRLDRIEHAVVLKDRSTKRAT